VVDFPDPETAPELDFDRGSDGMPERTRRAFQSRADTELGTRPADAITEIERVYRAGSDAVVSVSGGKDSMAMLALASQSDADHRVLHFDWGRRFIPRDVERTVVENIREYVPDERFFVASYERAKFEPYSENSHFRRNLHGEPGGEAYEGVGALAGALHHCEDIGTQLLGLRRGESGKRARKLDGLYGESLGLRAAFPLREWSARDVWAYLVDQDVPYPGHYDRLAATTGDGAPRAYERARFTTFFDPEFEEIGGAAMAVAEWRNRDLQ
jgi:3'-phosphoadenosine 5'-phosphosulfate sulfotransferase (PAPS reductase)/FAD synthetase